MEELRKKAFALQCACDFQSEQFDVKREAYAKSNEKLKEAKWYNKWYYKQKEHKAYSDLVITAGRKHVAQCLLAGIIEEIKEKENGNKEQN